jgi:hypothetical protein
MFIGSCGNNSGEFYETFRVSPDFTWPSTRNSADLYSAVRIHAFSIEYVFKANQLKWRNSQRFMDEWSDQACKVWKVFPEIKVGVLQTKSWILLLSLLCVLTQKVSLSLTLSLTHTHTHTHIYTHIYVLPLTRNIICRTSRVYFSVCEERLLAVLKWKETFLFSSSQVENDG